MDMALINRLNEFADYCNEKIDHNFTQLSYGRLISKSPVTVRKENGLTISAPNVKLFMGDKIVTEVDIDIPAPNITAHLTNLDGVHLAGMPEFRVAGLETVRVEISADSSESQKIELEIWPGVSVGARLVLISCSKNQNHLALPHELFF